jgi:hypothetical protein
LRLQFYGAGDGYWSKTPKETVYFRIQRAMGKSFPDDIASDSLSLDIEKFGKPKSLRFYMRLWRWGYERVRAFLNQALARLGAIHAKSGRARNTISDIIPTSSPITSNTKKDSSSSNAMRLRKDIYSASTVGRYQPNISSEALEDEYQAFERGVIATRERLEANPDERLMLEARARGDNETFKRLSIKALMKRLGMYKEEEG